ncbi:MAG TPA: ferritin family protein, partial [Aminivibrio sp.]|nr:ferritin family protein [Aminivibrio sp.]
MKGLSEAFAGESMANRKYLAFAEQAEKEGYPATAKLFRTIAEAETL